MRKSFVKRLLLLFVLLFTLFIILFIIYFIYNSQEVSSPFIYPYKDNEYLNVNSFKKCKSNDDLEQKVERLVISSLKNYMLNDNDIPQEIPDFISYDNYKKLRGAAKVYNIDYINYHCSYINSLCYKDKCIIIFDTSFINNYYCEYNGHIYYNKIYLKKNTKHNWYVDEVFIAPIG